MNKHEVADFQERLLALREDCRQELQERDRAVAEQSGSRGAASHVPTHPADQDSEGVAEEVEVARAERSVYDEVNAALERIEAGAFGICENCGRSISRERLDAVPYAALCQECQAAEETQAAAAQ